MKIISILLLSASMVGFAQTPSAPTKTTTVAASPAETALIKASKDLATEQASFNAIIAQARTQLGANQKEISDQITAIQKQIQDKINHDKKYKPMLSQLKTLQTQYQNAIQQANQKLGEQTSTVRTQISANKVIVDSLIDVVRKEKGLPDSSTFDINTQTWKK